MIQLGAAVLGAASVFVDRYRIDASGPVALAEQPDLVSIGKH